MKSFVVPLSEGADIEGFRKGLRNAIAARIEPENVIWRIGKQASLFGDETTSNAPTISLPRETADLINLVICHNDAERYALLYNLVWRIVRGERALLDIQSDPLVHRLHRMAKAIRRDIHKMHAFLRFRLFREDGDERFVAWFEPDHYILDATADFFVKRYPSMRWSILTPVGSLHWNLKDLSRGPAGSPCDVPATGEFEDAWDTYFRSTFNPARANVAQMRKEMPRKYWRNMQETRLIPDMLQSASARVDQMISAMPQAAIKRNPDKALPKMLDTNVKSLEELNAVIEASEPFVEGGQRAVIGEGPLNPAIAFVGEQPGDHEDLQGRPFVGPAGQLFDRALREAGIKRDQCYITNAVKHFKFQLRGKRRIHQKPTVGEVKHYRWWLMKELELVRPKLVVALGGTAALALTGKAISVSKSRGTFDFERHHGFVTFHPSYLLRLPDTESREQAYRMFVTDLIDAKERSRTTDNESRVRQHEKISRRI